MSELINHMLPLVKEASMVICQTGANEMAKSAAKGLLSYLEGLLSKKWARRSRNLAEQINANSQAIEELKALLEDAIGDNEELLKTLEQKVNDFESKIKCQKENPKSCSNTVVIKGDDNVSIVNNNGIIIKSFK